LDWYKEPKLADDWQKSVDQLAALAQKHQLWLNGSVLTRDEQGKYYNTSLLFESNGRIVGRYSKTHLFSYQNEAGHLAAGDALAVVETPWGKAGLAICYDLRFPEIFRAYALQGAALVLLPAAFPYPRRAHWRTLLRARAIEEQLFMVGTNRIGGDFFGTSCVIDPWGETVVEGSEDKEELLVAAIDLDKVKEVRNKMTVLQDRRPELYRDIIVQQEGKR
jgi:predicted amidohydrolase